ncbi:MAG: ABC transporter permease subunit [Eubacteriales bacterium]|nr:ABC transporter permease subunit [Eubacteriales bacterium]
MKHRTSLRRILIILFWILLWQAASQIIRNDILFAGPMDVVRSLCRLLPTVDFWAAIGQSFCKITLGFLAAFLCGILLGSLAFRLRLLKDLLEPLMLLSRSIPVASFVILALIWAGSENLSVFISFLVVLPMIYVNTLAGLASTDRQLTEMAEVFSLSLPRRVRFLYLPALMPYLASGCKTALGMSWKSGVAAEVIGVPSHTIGEGLYMAKIYLATPDVFAWTLVIILVSALFEQVFLLLLNRISQLNERSRL